MFATDADFPPDLKVLERQFELIREIGQGGMAAVYLARRRDTGRLVAIKAIRGRYLDDPDAVRRFAREAHTVAGLNHPNIVRTEAVEQIDDRAIAIIMAHVAGGTVRDRLRENGPLGAEDAEAILRDVASALRYAHQRGIVHRDVKPENVFLDVNSGRAVLSDFGIARSISGDASITLLGAALGTPQYMSPEQIDGAVVDGRSDIYSLGVLGWELLTGRRPWAGESLYGVIYKQKHEDLPRITSLRPRVPANLLFAIEGALKKDREQRFQTIDEFLDQLTYDPPPLLSQTFPPGATRASDAPTVMFRSSSLTSGAADLDLIHLDDIPPAPADPVSAGPVVESLPVVVSDPIPVEPAHPVGVTAAPNVESTPAVRGPVATVQPAPSAAPPPPPSVLQPPLWRRQRTRRALALAIPLAIAGTTLYVALGGSADSEAQRRGAKSVTTSAGSLVADAMTPPRRVAVTTHVDTTPPPPGQLIIEGEDPDSDAPLYPKRPSRPPESRRQSSARTSSETKGPAPVSTDVSRAPAESSSTPNVAAPAPDKAAEPELEDPFKFPSTPSPTATASPATKGSVPIPRCRIASNADQTACLAAYIARGDGEMVGAFESLVNELRLAAGSAPGTPDPSSVGRVRVEQRAWLSVRNAECSREPAPGAGSFWAQATSQCFSDMAAARAAELRDAVQRLRRSRESALRPN